MPDPPLVPLGSILKDLAHRHPALRERMEGTLLLTSSPLFAQRPELAAFPIERLGRVLCRTCRGWSVEYGGDAGEEWACAACRGTGLCCPTCRGARWVLSGGRPGHRALARCPTCPTAPAEHAAILAYLREE